MKRAMVGLLAVLMILGLQACGKKDPAAGGSEVRRISLAAIPKSTGGEFWEAVEKGARKAAAELDVDLKWEGTVTETEIAEQNKIVENMINLGVKGIALAPLNRVAMRKMVEQAVAAGIPVVVFDSSVDGDKHSSFVATDNRAGGTLGGEKLASLLEPGSRAMVMRFVQGTGSTEDRAAGAIAALKSAGHSVVADPYPDTGTVEGCKTAAANTLESFVKDGKLDLDGVFAANLYATLGVAEALSDLRKGGVQVNVRFVGFDTSEKLLQGVAEGSIDALVAQNPERMGYLAVKTLAAVVKGEPVDSVVDTGVELLTRESLSPVSE